MMEKIKANLSHVICAGMGLTHFILLAFRYVGWFVKSNGEKQADKFCSGYGLMKFGNFEGSDGAGLAIFAGILQILLTILALGMLAYGVMGLLKGLGVFEQFPDKVGSMDSKKISDLALLAYGATVSLILLLMLVWCLLNTESTSWGSYKLRAGFRVGYGLILNFIIGGAGIACPFVLPKLIGGMGESSGPQITYRCAKCGKKANKTEKFCNACGGNIIAEEVKQYNYVCSGCGKKAKKTDKFCNVCGGAIEAVEVKHYEHVCSGCGKKAKKTDKFCNVCGGAIVEREIVAVPVAPAAPAAPAAPVAGNVCATCGNVIGAGNKFCNVCGTPVAPAAPAARVCPTCGKEVAEGNKFCNGCGTML